MTTPTQALTQAAARFLEYAELHQDKMVPGLSAPEASAILAKVARNQEMARLCQTALASATALDGLLAECVEFLELEAENRGASGSTYSDYAREPRDLADRLTAFLNANREAQPHADRPNP